MKAIYFIGALVALVAFHGDAAVLKSQSRANLIVGNIYYGDTLLARQQLVKYPISNAIQSEDFVYRGSPRTNITAIRVYEQFYTQYANAWIMAGGVGRSNITIRVQSNRGNGYNYIVELYGRY